MAKKGENREYIDLECTVCRNQVIRSEKNKKNNPDRLEIKKFCVKCKKSTTFKEKK